MTSILCLAHYCELHGPTPLMVTEGLPVACTTCLENDCPYTEAPDGRPHTSAQAPHMPSSSAAAITDALRRMNLTSHRSSSVPASEQEAQTHRAALLRISTNAPLSPLAIETPPESPRRLPEQVRGERDSGFRKTYDDSVTRKMGPCENCALTLPKRQEAPGKTELKNDARGPTLRTRVPCAKVYAGSQTSPPTSLPSSASSDTDGEHREGLRHYRRSTVTTTSRSSMSSADQPSSHTHYLNYTSTHVPLVPASFTIVRNSCLRTLSLETLPRPPATTSPPGFVTTQNAGSAASGGPIFFGDPVAGYTTAYIFRIPDLHARGHKRVYAFLALSTHKERVAMKTFGFVAAAFREMAEWIQGLAEAEAEKTTEASPVGGPYSSVTSPVQERDFSDRGSSFLSGGSAFARRMGGGGGSLSLKQRGLAELVGLPDFFIQLHKHFVHLLLELGVVLNS